MRKLVLSPIFISLFEYACIFLIAGFVLIMPSTQNDISQNWSDVTGVIFVLIYLGFWIADMIIFINRNLKLVNYTFLTFIGRIISGILVNIYATTKYDAIFCWGFFFLTTTMAISILRALKGDGSAFVFHLINIFILVIGTVLVSLASSRGVNAYYGFIVAMTVLLFQISVFHELGLVRYLWSLDEKEWEYGFIHIAPRLTYYIKWFWEKDETQRKGRVLEFDDL